LIDLSNRFCRAVISDPSVNGKYALVDDAMIPDIAILDPVFTLTVPSSVTADHRIIHQSIFAINGWIGNNRKRCDLTTSTTRCW
jgi:alcohol dehydrogenase YqhD (iron-dependent ADH family)